MGPKVALFTIGLFHWPNRCHLLTDIGVQNKLKAALERITERNAQEEVFEKKIVETEYIL